VALWKEQVPTPKKDVPPALSLESTPRRELDTVAPEPSFAREPVRNTSSRDVVESVIGTDLMIEGKIEGRGHVRIAGRFKGDVVVDGNLTIDAGARLIGGMKATAITIAGEVQGNVIDANRVELLPSGVLVGDLKATTLTVAAGSRMRGHVEFGWTEPQPSSTPQPSSSPSKRTEPEEVLAPVS
jgi:cytoskeletal protein CcmA (bactofilin family)